MSKHFKLNVGKLGVEQKLIDNNEWKCIKSMVYKLYITVVQVILKGVKQHNIKRYNNTGAIYICAFL